MIVGQPRLQSATEVVTGRVIGSFGKLMSVWAAAWLSGAAISGKGYGVVWAVGLLFSFVWGYFYRRLFNWWHISRLPYALTPGTNRPPKRLTGSRLDD